MCLNGEVVQALVRHDQDLAAKVVPLLREHHWAVYDVDRLEILVSGKQLLLVQAKREALAAIRIIRKQRAARPAD